MATMPTWVDLHLVPRRTSRTTSDTSSKMKMAYIAKVQPSDVASTNGCRAAMAAPADKHLTTFDAACAVADRLKLKSVRRVPHI